MRGMILATLMVLASCLTTYTFPFGATVDGLDYRPRELLPGLVTGDLITWEIFFFRDSGFAPTTYRLDLTNSTFHLLGSQPSGFNTNQAITFNTTITHSYTVPSAGDYGYDMRKGDSFSSVVPFYMIVKKNGVQISKYVNILKGVVKLTKMLYLDATKDLTIDLSVGNIILYSLANNTFEVTSTLTASSTSGTAKTFANLPAGYYFIDTSGLSGGSPSGTIVYQSDPFPCFHDPAYSDYQLLFAPCIQPSSSSSLQTP